VLSAQSRLMLKPPRDSDEWVLCVRASVAGLAARRYSAIELPASAEENAVPRRTRGAPCLVFSEFGKPYRRGNSGNKIDAGRIAAPVRSARLSLISRAFDCNPCYRINVMRYQKPVTNNLGHGEAIPAKRRYEPIYMHIFHVGQKWVLPDPTFGIFYGEVVEISDNGRSGTVIITDEEDNPLDSFSGSAAVFQASGDWQLAE